MTAGWAYLTQLALPNRIKEISATEAQIVLNKKQLTQLTKLREANDFLSVKKRILDKIVRKTEHWSGYLEAIRRNVPPGVQISSMNFEKDGAHILGNARDFSSVSDLAVNLSGEPIVKNASLQYAQRNEKHPEMVDFLIVAEMDSTTPDGAIASNSVSPPSQQNPVETVPPHGVTLPEFVNRKTSTTTETVETNQQAIPRR